MIQPTLEITEYLDYLKTQKQSNNLLKYSEILKEETPMVTMN